jgi:hydrogenase maturation protein HypF
LVLQTELSEGSNTAPGSLSQRKLRVTGIVQGVGFRPFVYRLARSHKLAGWVCNTSNGVEIQVAGPPASLESFVRKLSTEAPALARLDAYFDRFREELRAEFGSVVDTAVGARGMVEALVEPGSCLFYT